MRTLRDSHELQYWLALTYLDLGDRRSALEHLVATQADSTNLKQHAWYAAQVELLEPTPGPVRLEPRPPSAN